MLEKVSARSVTHHIRHQGLEVLDGLLSLVLLALAVDLFSLLRAGLLDLPLSLPKARLDPRLSFQLLLLLSIHVLQTERNGVVQKHSCTHEGAAEDGHILVQISAHETQKRSTRQ